MTFDSVDTVSAFPALVFAPAKPLHAPARLLTTTNRFICSRGPTQVDPAGRESIRRSAGLLQLLKIRMCRKEKGREGAANSRRNWNKIHNEIKKQVRADTQVSVKKKNRLSMWLQVSPNVCWISP